MLYIDNTINALWVNRTLVPMATLHDNNVFLQIAYCAIELSAGERQVLYTPYVRPFLGASEGKHTLDWFIDELAKVGIEVAVRLGISRDGAFAPPHNDPLLLEFKILEGTCLPLVTRYDPLRACPLLLEFQISKSHIARVLTPRMSDPLKKRIGGLSKRSLILRR